MNTNLCRCGFGQDPEAAFEPIAESGADFALADYSDLLGPSWAGVGVGDIDYSAQSSWVGDWSGDWNDAPGFIDPGTSWSFWDSAGGKFLQDVGTKLAVSGATTAITGALAPAGSAAATAQQRAAAQAAAAALSPKGIGLTAAPQAALRGGASQPGTLGGKAPTPTWVWPATIGGVALVALVLFSSKRGKRR